MLITGHHLEWMALCEPHVRPQEHILERAIIWLNEHIPRYKELMKNDWFAFLPISHAVRAICKLHGMDWPDERRS